MSLHWWAWRDRSIAITGAALSALSEIPGLPVYGKGGGSAKIATPGDIFKVEHRISTTKSSDKKRVKYIFGETITRCIHGCGAE